LRNILIFVVIIFFNACSKTNKSNDNSNHIVKQKNDTIIKSENNITFVNINNIRLKFQKGALMYPDKKIIILFANKNAYSKTEEIVLKKLNVPYFKTDSPYLIDYFRIKEYPTIIVLDKNRTIKYENFTPFEILKAEGF